MSNHSCDKDGSSSHVNNNTPLINDNINVASSSKDSNTSNSYSTSEANAIYLVLGGSPLLIMIWKKGYSNWEKLLRILLNH